MTGARGREGEGRPVVGRFAPSPTGRMHAGNVYAALMAWLVARSRGGEVVLRMEDLDVERSRREHADQIMADFESLGLTWDRGPYWQQGREEAYAEAFRSLDERGLVYPCYCTRADLRAASAPHRGEKRAYPGTCRSLTRAQREEREAQGRHPAWRLRVPSLEVGLVDGVQGPYAQDLARDCGDFVVRRSDGLFAYQLAVVVDDADQGVTSVVRGVDLLCSTPQQAYLGSLLGHAAPSYAHVPLLTSAPGRRLAKRDGDAGLEEMCARYGSPAAVLGRIAWQVGLIDEEMPVRPEELLKGFDLARWAASLPDRVEIPWRG